MWINTKIQWKSAGSCRSKSLNWNTKHKSKKDWREEEWKIGDDQDQLNSQQQKNTKDLWITYEMSKIIKISK